MPLSPSPDLSSSRRLLATAAVTSLVATAVLVWRFHDIATSLGDTDDAMRLVMVRELLGGRGWYDQEILRLQPPLGVFMHWSRLLDGAIAAMTAALRLVLAPAQAEFWTRFAWPLLWVFPAVLSGLAVAGVLGRRSAVFACAILLVLDQPLYIQFRPGRIDHHNVQITLTMIAVACALARGERQARWAIATGLASALGLAIGIEALAFHALIGTSFGVRLMFDRKAAGAARAYGFSLAMGAVAFLAIQTPPDRWFLPFCDALGANLALTLAIAGLGLTLVSSLTERLSPRARVGAVALVGLIAAGCYVGADPDCLRGPFGSVDPRVRSFWFDHIQELEAWPTLFFEHRDAAVHSMAAAMLTAPAAIWLAIRGRAEPARGDWLLAACAAVAVVAQAKAYRMQDYGLWFGLPAVAIGIADFAAAWLSDKMVLVGLAAVLLSPSTLADGASVAIARLPNPPGRPADHCYDTRSYARLARLPAGIVLAEPDLGPFVLANTRDSALSAPYHRMTWGILAEHDALSQPAGPAEAAVRALGASYIVDCPAHILRVAPGGVGEDIREGHPPSWLTPLSGHQEALKIYQVVAAPPQRGP